MSVIIAQGVKPPHQDLIYLSQQVFTSDHFKECFPGALTRVDNPFIPGLTISVALEKAVETARAGRTLLLFSLHQQVDEFILEVLERLPQVVRDFTGGLRGCAEVFEPDSKRACPAEFVGPLNHALQNPHYASTLCTVPIVADYIPLKFVSDLPHMLDTEGGFGIPCTLKKEQEESPQRANLVANDDLGRLMQGFSRTLVSSGAPNDGTCPAKPAAEGWRNMACSGDLLFPGVQFIVVGVASKPFSHSKVRRGTIARQGVLGRGEGGAG